jgi:hypothetical protein
MTTEDNRHFHTIVNNRKSGAYIHSHGRGFVLLIVSLLMIIAPLPAMADGDWFGGRDWYAEDRFFPDIPPLQRPQPIDQQLKNGFQAFQQQLSGEEKGFDLAAQFDRLDPPGQDGLLGRYSILGNDALYFLVPAFALMGVIYALPENISNWNKDDISFSHGWENWKYNSTTWVWDQDDAWINYIGHPYFGSTYFIYARHYGYSRLESLWFSFSISTFYEIGIEAWAEPVSIQDLVVTPLGGWAVAEILLPLEHRIHRNNDTVLGSRVLGAVSLFLIDPFGHVVPPLKRLAREYLSPGADVTFSSHFAMHAPMQPDEYSPLSVDSPRVYGLRCTVTW